MTGILGAGRSAWGAQGQLMMLNGRADSVARVGCYTRVGCSMKLTVVLEPSDEGGYTVYAPSLLRCISEGDTKEEALGNITEAIELYRQPTTDARPSDA